MPELPEVETVTRDLSSHLPGLVIEDVVIHDSRVVLGDGQAFRESVIHETIECVSRQGKMIVLHLTSGRFVTVQLRMTGYVLYGSPRLDRERTRETKLVLRLSNGQVLLYNDHRLFGKWQYVQRLEEVAYLRTLGPEPLNGALSVEQLRETFRKRTSPIKTLLMNQQVIAGIGNIYASEICFDAAVDPRRRANALTVVEIQRLCDSVRRILEEAVELRGTSMRDYRDASGERGRYLEKIRVYGRHRQSCRRCQTPVEKIVQTGRSTFYCPVCQT